MKTIGIGLIGLGHHGTRYARHLSGNVPGVSLAAVCRRDRSRGAPLARELGTRYFEDYRDLLDDPAVDAIVIVSPTSRHLEMAVAAAERGKPILLEKPIGVTAAEADRIIKAARTHSAPLMVAQTLRFEPLAMSFRESLPLIGRVRAINLQHRSPDIRIGRETSGEQDSLPGVLLDTGVHYFDLLGWLFPSRLEKTSCETRCYNRTHSEDSFVAALSGPDLLATVDICRATPARQETWVAVGEKGILEGDRFRGQLHLITPGKSDVLPAPRPAPTLPGVLRSFVHSVRTGEPFEVTAEAARAAVAIADACMRSAETGEPEDL
ncbi:MAG: Gfo/Idh/MocA family oxidoreductase [Candidatus Eisenbacteria sp.]|nr:Gfo/Idh/MocA family oxidoreductase [Candidatus Eisenbacteria bacterium]